jgi:hypothetical protein
MKASPEGVPMNDHTDSATSDDEPWPAWCHPLRAKDMLGVTAHIIRNMLVSGSHDELYEIYGIRPKEAKQSLHYVELAELRAWGIDEMIEAALPGQSSSEDRLRRRIVLAMKAEEVPESLHPGDAVLLLERSGLMLVDELRDAIVCMSTRSYAEDENGLSLTDMNRLRRLLGKPAFTDEEAQAWLADDFVMPKYEQPPAVQPSAGKFETAPLVSTRPPQARQLQEEDILRVITALGLTATAIPKPLPGKSGPKAEVRKHLKLSSKVFDLAWERLRSDGRIADAPSLNVPPLI